MFPKPTSTKKEKTPYNSLQSRKRAKKELPDWKKDLFSHHKSNPSKADRAEFPKSVVKEAIERSQGICQHCKQAPCTTTHHSYGRGRGGRGVLSNAYRACGNCHIDIEGNDELKNAIIEEYRILYGDRFWYDDQDWDEFNQKQSIINEAERSKQQREERLEPVVSILTTACGRTLKAREMRLLSGMDDKEIVIFEKLMSDVVGQSSGNKPEFGYGYFDD